MSTRYAVATHRMKEAERSQDPSELLSFGGNEMASIIRDGDSSLVELPTAWAGLAMVHKAQHEISSAYESEQHVLTEMEERAVCSLKQVVYYFPPFIACFLLSIYLLIGLLSCTVCSLHSLSEMPFFFY